VLINFDSLLEKIPERALVLDLGGWERVFPRANTVVDLMPFETRKRQDFNIPERFTAADWIVADFCNPDFWDKIPDKAYDFITIGHTLEDIRDPLYVCRQMIRCGKAGYIEFPSLFRECSMEKSYSAFPGYDHHRWIIEPSPGLEGLVFKAKLPFAFKKDYLGSERRFLIDDYYYQFDGVFWEGSFTYVEHFSKGTKIESENLEYCFEKILRTDARRNNVFNLNKDSESKNDGKCIWVDDYKLPVEIYRENIDIQYYQRYS